MTAASIRSTTTAKSAALTRARAQIPAWGLWWTAVDVQSPVALDVGERVTVAIADVELSGYVVSGRAAHGRAAYRIAAGAGGWHSSVAAASYHDEAGVRISDVITDAAALVGEAIADVPSTRTGPHFTRRAGAASSVLHELAPRAWYVGLDGVTRFGARAPSTYEGSAPRVAIGAAQDTIDLAVESLSGLVPGVMVDTLSPATDVEYTLDAKRLTARVYGGVRSSRQLDALRRVLDALDPRRAFRAVYEYRVVTRSGDALNLQPVRASAGMPDLADVPVRLAPGVKASHQLGSLVTVAFLDGDPSRPRVISGDDADAPGWMPDDLQLGEAPALGVARLGDSAVCGPWSGAITSASVRVKAGL